MSAIHLTAHDRGVPSPDGLKSDDERIFSSLLAATENKGKVPCEYLGLDMGNGQFEPDPAKWRPGSYPAGRKSHATVAFEWKHVARGDSKEPHRVRLRADKAKPQGVPQNPLEQSGPKSLWFSVEFMQAYAEQRWPGTVYTGISYEMADGRNSCVGSTNNNMLPLLSSSRGATAPTSLLMFLKEASRSRIRPCTGRYPAGEPFA